VRIYQGIILAMLVSTPAQAVECLASPPGKSYSWRIIDGKRCFYVGRHRLEKIRLHWPTYETTTRPRRAPPQQAQAPEEDLTVQPQSEVWPKLPDVPKVQDQVRTPQQRIDDAFRCLAIHQRGYSCE
jgi:hypothetical protein